MRLTWSFIESSILPLLLIELLEDCTRILNHYYPRSFMISFTFFARTANSRLSASLFTRYFNTVLKINTFHRQTYTLHMLLRLKRTCVYHRLETPVRINAVVGIPLPNPPTTTPPPSARPHAIPTANTSTAPSNRYPYNAPHLNRILPKQSL